MRGVDGYDVIRAMVLWIHAVAAVAWVGGSIFYLVVLRPALIKTSVSQKALEIAINKGFKEVVDVSIIALILTGAFITFDRFSSAPVAPLYFAVLGTKLVAVLTMLLMARQLGTRTGRILRARVPAAASAEPSLREAPPQTSLLRRWLAPSRLVLLLGLATLFLSMVLARIYEHNLGSMV